MSRRIRFGRCVPVVAIVGLVLTMVFSAPILSQSASAAKGGNSQNAKLCQQGGWQGLQNSDGVPFSSEEECVASGAQGAGVVPIPPGPTESITITFWRYSDIYCSPIVHMTGFAPNTTYEYRLYKQRDGFGVEGIFLYSILTDGDGNGSTDRLALFFPVIESLEATMGGVSSGWIQINC